MHQEPRRAPTHTQPYVPMHKAGRCRDGASCLFPHRETGGVLAVQQQPSNKFTQSEEKKAKDVAEAMAKAKPKAKPKGKAKADKSS